MVSNKRIYVSNVTHERLKALKYDDNESFDSVIRKLLDTKLDSGPLKYNVSCGECNVDIVVDWDASMANITYVLSDGESYLLFPDASYIVSEFKVSEWNRFREYFLKHAGSVLNVCAVLDSGEEFGLGFLNIRRY